MIVAHLIIAALAMLTAVLIYINEIRRFPTPFTQKEEHMSAPTETVEVITKNDEGETVVETFEGQVGETVAEVEAPVAEAISEVAETITEFVSEVVVGDSEGDSDPVAEYISELAETVNVADLIAEDLRDAADVLEEAAPHALALLGDPQNTYFGWTAEQLRQLAEAKDEYDAQELEKAQLAAALARHEAILKERLIDQVASTLSRVGTRRSQAEKLVETFNITLKAA